MHPEQERSLAAPIDDGWCFVCGKENPHGLCLEWTVGADGAARALFRPERRHQGWRGILHGGIVAALIDEAMAQCARVTGKPAMTASLEIRYRSAVPIGAELVAEARVVGERGRLLQLEGSVRDGRNETCYATARGTCMRVRPVDQKM